LKIATSAEKSALFEHRKEVRHATLLVVGRKIDPVLGTLIQCI